MAKYRITIYREEDGTEVTYFGDGYALQLQTNDDLIFKSELSILRLLPHLPKLLKALNLDPKAVAGFVTIWINKIAG